MVGDTLIEREAGRCPCEKQTNNEAELYACLTAIRLGGGEDILIRTDSVYVMNWMAKLKKGIINRNGILKAENPELVLLLLAAVKGIADKIQVQKVKAHSELPGPDKDGNDAADVAAKRGRTLPLELANKEIWPEAIRYKVRNELGRETPKNPKRRDIQLSLGEARRQKQRREAEKGNAMIRINAASGAGRQNTERMNRMGVGRTERTRRTLVKTQTGHEQKYLSRGEVEDTCVLCGMKDSKWHRLVGCGMLRGARNGEGCVQAAKWLEEDKTREWLPLEKQIREEFTFKGRTVYWKDENGVQYSLFVGKFWKLVRDFLDGCERGSLWEWSENKLWR
jgi:ribonuclease HI